MGKPIKSGAGLARAWKAVTNRAAKLSRRDYIKLPALERYLAHFKRVDDIKDPTERFEAFRRIPSLEYEMFKIDDGLAPEQRTSLAQQDRARRPRVRVTADRRSIREIIADVVQNAKGPWDKRAKELWRPFVERLQMLGLNPERPADLKDSSVEAVQYGAGDSRRRISLRQFENIVSEIRRSLKAAQLRRSG